ncbi:MAG TPA: substrate-binding domain-containing protein, partial [Polyangiaceae bacterium]
MADALAGLHYAHELRDFSGTLLNVVHRDVSPHNVFVTYDGQVKIFDFGVAKAESRLEGTDAGVLKGKLVYMSPEQAAGDAVDRRADVFSAGVVLWELLSLRQLVTRDSSAAALRQVLHGSVPQLPESLADVDQELRGIVAKALERDKSERYQSAGELRAALLGYLDKHPFAQDDLARFMLEQFQSARAELQQRIQATIFPGGNADPIISVSETELGDDPLLFGVDDEQLPVLDSGSFGLARHERTESLLPLPTAPRAQRLSGSSAGPVGRSQSVTPPEPQLERRWALGALALIALGVAAFVGLRPPAPFEARAGARVSAAPNSPVTAVPMLRIHGSNTIGSELGPALAEAYLRAKGQENVRRRPSRIPEQVTVSGSAPFEANALSIELRAEGSATAFADLASHNCDIGMSSRPIKPAEAQELARQGLGDLQTPAGEHVIGLDGIAVIVHPNNPLRSLNLEQLRRLFTGKMPEFPAIPARSGGVHVYARDDHSGTFDTFKHLVLSDEPLAAGSKRLLDSSALSDAVASDPQAIGFIGIAYVRNAKPVAIGEAGASPLYASAFTVGTEDYALTRRLYLYLPVQTAAKSALDFVNFALSAQGQSVVRSAGFVDLNVAA